jgi:hypothetical protein
LKLISFCRRSQAGSASELQRVASLNLQAQTSEMRRHDLEAAKLEADARLQQAEAHRLELANEEKRLQLALMRQQLRSNSESVGNSH